MAVERRSPLPVGRYWVDIIDRNGEVLLFDFWLKRGENAGKLKLINREDRGTTTFSIDYSGIRYTFFLFDVLEPIEWPRGKGFGYPSIAQSERHPNAPKIEKSEDTGSRPRVPGPLDTIADLLGDAKTIAILFVGAYLLTRSNRR
jgi:hypothetical protein